MTHVDLQRGHWRRLYSAGVLLGRRYNRLPSMEHEGWFIRLVCIADDFGNLPGTALELSRMAAPKREISAAQAEELTNTLGSVDLIRRYDVDGEQYIHIAGWEELQPTDWWDRSRNRRRAAKKYPLSPWNTAGATDASAGQRDNDGACTAAQDANAKRAAGPTSRGAPNAKRSIYDRSTKPVRSRYEDGTTRKRRSTNENDNQNQNQNKNQRYIKPASLILAQGGNGGGEAGGRASGQDCELLEDSQEIQPVAAALEARLGRPLGTSDLSSLARLAAGLDADPAELAGQVAATDALLIAAIEAMPPGVGVWHRYVAATIDRSRADGQWPVPAGGSSGGRSDAGDDLARAQANVQARAAAAARINAEMGVQP